MDLSWHALNSTIQVKTRCHTEKQLTKFQTLPLKVNLLPAKLGMLSPLSSRVREFWPQVYSLGCHCPSATSAAPQTFLLTSASCSHSTSTSLHFFKIPKYMKALMFKPHTFISTVFISWVSCHCPWMSVQC